VGGDAENSKGHGGGPVILRFQKRKTGGEETG